MTKDEALKLALEALELNNDEWKSLADSGDCGYWNAEDQDHYKQTNKTINAIKQALAAPVQPVAWGVFEGNLHDMFFSQVEAEHTAYLKGAHAEVRPLYTTPPAAQRQWVGLTDEEWQDLSDRYGMILFGRFKNEIEDKLKEKNT
jgi:uncharacterized cysteine cluster protein YcgN (CxxCxxCC family)